MGLCLTQMGSSSSHLHELNSLCGGHWMSWTKRALGSHDMTKTLLCWEVSGLLWFTKDESRLLNCLKIFLKMTLDRNDLWITSKRICISIAESYPECSPRGGLLYLPGKGRFRHTLDCLSYSSVHCSLKSPKLRIPYPRSPGWLISPCKKSRWPGCHKVPRRELVGVRFIGTEMTECQFPSQLHVIVRNQISNYRRLNWIHFQFRWAAWI